MCAHRDAQLHLSCFQQRLHSVCHVLTAAVAAGGDGSVIFWLLGQQEALVKIEAAHENGINGLAFHPAGHEMTTCESLPKLLLHSGTAGWVECMADQFVCVCMDSLLPEATRAQHGCALPCCCYANSIRSR
jgi:hypothetical protein